MKNNYSKLLKLACIAGAIMLCVISMKAQSQKLSDLYKNNEIMLEEVTNYANKNNWEQLFTDIDKVEYDKKTGQSKGIVVTPDGSVFMCHQTLYEIWKFDKNGNFGKKFGSKGSKDGQFTSHFGLNCTYDGKYIFTSDNQGCMLFFDTDGNFFKKLKVDYMPLYVVPLKDSKIAVLGFVVGKTNKNIITVKDINTGKERIVWSQNDESIEKTSIVVKLPKGGMMSFSLPYCHSSYTRARLATSKNGNLLIGLPESGNIIEYSPDGTKLNSFTLGITPLTISDKDINENYESYIKQFDDFEKRINNSKKYNAQEKKETIEQFKNQLSKLKDRSLYPKHLPYFSSLLLDSDGNILVFEFTKEAETNKFRAYAFDSMGKEIGSSSFVSNAYDISFVPSTFSFSNGYIYAVATKKSGGKVPLRLVKFKCSIK